MTDDLKQLEIRRLEAELAQSKSVTRDWINRNFTCQHGEQLAEKDRQIQELETSNDRFRTAIYGPTGERSIRLGLDVQDWLDGLSEVLLGRKDGKLSDMLTAIISLEAQIKELQFQKVFEQQFADKLKEFGTVDRLIEGYSATKMKARNLESSLKSAEEKLQKAEAALDTARAALHHCDIRHKKCACSAEAIAEIDPILKELRPAVLPEKGDQ